MNVVWSTHAKVRAEQRGVNVANITQRLGRMRSLSKLAGSRGRVKFGTTHAIVEFKADHLVVVTVTA